MTVAELKATMTVDEEVAWVEYHAMIAEERAAAIRQSKAGSGGNGRRRR